MPSFQMIHSEAPRVRSGRALYGPRVHAKSAGVIRVIGITELGGRLWRRGGMKKASEYRQHAKECRSLAKGLPAGEQRDQMLNMAGVWEKLAADRTTLFLRTHAGT